MLESVSFALNNYLIGQTIDITVNSLPNLLLFTFCSIGFSTTNSQTVKKQMKRIRRKVCFLSHFWPIKFVSSETFFYPHLLLYIAVVLSAAAVAIIVSIKHLE